MIGGRARAGEVVWGVYCLVGRLSVCCSPDWLQSGHYMVVSVRVVIRDIGDKCGRDVVGGVGEWRRGGEAAVVEEPIIVHVCNLFLCK